MTTENTLPTFKVKKLVPEAQLPVMATPGAACYDVCAVGLPPEGVTVPQGASYLFGTGLAFGMPAGWCIEGFSRSGHGYKNGVSLSNSVAQIDTDYTGELKISLRNDGSKPFEVFNGNRIAQIKFERVNEVVLVEWDGDLDSTERGAGGFGSTGRDAIAGGVR